MTSPKVALVPNPFESAGRNVCVDDEKVMVCEQMCLPLICLRFPFPAFSVNASTADCENAHRTACVFLCVLSVGFNVNLMNQ
jgi:hypothetical protein